MIKKWIHVLLIGAGVVSLAACNTNKKPSDQAALNSANTGYSSQAAQASGLGSQSTFGEDTAGGRMANQRTYYFDFDKDIVHDSDRPAIIANANYLLSHPNTKILLEGHTDPQGSREYNIGLGERRAKAVAAILAQKGVSRDQIRIVSYGAEKLASNGHTEADYQQDRRSVLLFTQK